ncbi:N-acetylmuramoyl-L-alanine amidase [Streptacidiphilus sp. 4-A2]|nr:N-acetylmuramoyl-L-alanine amidase [Streptacidiphilus sp. 4-A2]
MAAAALVIGTVAEAAPGSRPPAPKPRAAAKADPNALAADFTSAAAEFHVPVDVLLAVSYQETLWDSHQGAPSSTGNYNVMGLTQVEPSDLTPATKAQKEESLASSGDGRKHPAPSAALLSELDTVDTAAPALHTLDTAAALLRQPTSALRSSMKQSVRGGAALLASYERKLNGSLPADPGQWYAAVAEYDQAPDTGTAAQFADRVYATITGGASRTTADGETMTLPATPSVTPAAAQTQPGALQAVLAPAAPPTPAPTRPATAHPAGTTAAGTTAASPSAPAASPSAPPSPSPSATQSAPPTPPAPPAPTPCPQVPAELSGACGFVAANPANYEAANRPTDGDAIRYIVIHDTDASTASAVSAFQDPSDGSSTHYVISASGAVTQLLPTQDAGVQAANATVNMHAIGIEHEGYLLKDGSWFSEQEYESSADLVQYLAKLYNIPLDRDHILGQDDVPYAFDTASAVSAQGVDPGTYWDWGHYLSLLGAPVSGDGDAVVGGTVTIAPPYGSSYEPTVTGCSGSGSDCSPRPADFVYLRTGPSDSAALIGDPVLSAHGLKSAGSDADDVSDKAGYGQTFVVAALSGNWTAIWYGGREAWFYNPGGAYAYANSNPAETLVTPVGDSPVQVYGRAYPQPSAYPASQARLAAAPAQQIGYGLLPYTIPAGQAYTSDGEVSGDYYASGSAYSPGDTTCAQAGEQCEIIDGGTQYYQIRYNHRIGYVLASQVQTITAAVPPTGTYMPVTPKRVLDTRAGSGGAHPLGAGDSLELPVTGVADVPATGGVTAVVVNVTVSSESSSGSLTVYPDGESRPKTPDLFFPAWRVVPDLVTVPVLDGKIDLYNAVGTVDAWVDMVGYYTSAGTGSRLVGFGPTRVLDTRYGQGVTRDPVGAGQHVSLQVAGIQGAPADVTAVVMNVTATDATRDTWVTVYPDSATDGGNDVPATSNLDLTPDRTVPNLVIVPVTDGKVDFYNAEGSVDLFADITGYFTSDPGGGVFHTLAPTRLLDTRNGTGSPADPVGPGGTISLQVAGNSGIPLKGVTAVVLNVTATGPTAASWITVYPDGSTGAQTSTLDVTPGLTVPNLVVVPVVDGSIDFSNARGDVNLVADVTGFFTAG